MAPESTVDHAPASKPPYRQVRALHDSQCITVYQAYNSTIASAAVSAQKLNASPLFKSRMTWIKPSWCWVNYRAGYSFKDRNQERILAIKMSHEGFLELLRGAVLTTHENGSDPVNHMDEVENRLRTRQEEEMQKVDAARSNMKDAEQVKTTVKEESMLIEKRKASIKVKVQWDPERSPRLGRLEYRSIQIGIPANLVDKWIRNWIIGIEDVTEKARNLKAALDADKKIEVNELKARGLMPEECVYEVPSDIRKILGMDLEAPKTD